MLGYILVGIKTRDTKHILSVAAISLLILLRYLFMTLAIQGAVPVWLHTLWYFFKPWNASI